MRSCQNPVPPEGRLGGSTLFPLTHEHHPFPERRSAGIVGYPPETRQDRVAMRWVGIATEGRLMTRDPVGAVVRRMIQ